MGEKPSGVAESNATAADLSRQFEEYKEANPGWKSYTLLPGSPWVSVKERLPEQNTDVLVSVDENSDDCGMHVCDYYDGKFSRAEAGYIWGVTHWMPLPAPPTDAK